VAQFSGGLTNACTLADLKLNRMLNALDEAASRLAIDDQVGSPERFEPTRTNRRPVTEIELATEGIGTVIWATGLRPDHSWIDLPVFDHRGRIRHTGGVVDRAPGVYVLGLNVLRRRRSSYIGGADRDTAELADHLHRHLAATLGAAATEHRLAGKPRVNRRQPAARR
jgi:putative flavoprotein involved in K+ transport